MTKTFEQYKVVVDLVSEVDMEEVAAVFKSKLGEMNGEINPSSLTGITIDEWNNKKIVMTWTILHEDPESRIENTMFYATGEEDFGLYQYDYVGEVEVEI